MAGNVVPASRLGLTYTIQMRWESTVGEDRPMRGGTGSDFPGQVSHDEKGFRERP